MPSRFLAESPERSKTRRPKKKGGGGEKKKKKKEPLLWKIDKYGHVEGKKKKRGDLFSNFRRSSCHLEEVKKEERGGRRGKKGLQPNST